MPLSKQILWVFGVIAAVAVLYVGALYAVQKGAPSLPPSVTTSAPSKPIVNPFGTVTARSSSSVTIKGVNNSSQTFTIASSTQILDSKGAPAKSGTLVVGAIVTVVAQGSVASVIRILPPVPPLPMPLPKK